MKALPASLALLILAGCDDIPRARSEADIRRVAAEGQAGEMRRLEARINGLEERLGEAETDIKGVRALGIENAENADRFVETFNRNVKMDNEASVRAMTARGACGQEVYYDDYNVARSRNRQCTLKDLR